MISYDPAHAPDPAAWLHASEDTRLGLALSYHEHANVDLPNARIHAAIHVVVENQLALPEPIVVDALARLEKEGMSRHDAIHAIGSVVAEHMFELLKTGRSVDKRAAAAAYLERVKRLTATDSPNAG